MIHMEDYLKFNDIAKIYDDLASDIIKDIMKIPVDTVIQYNGEMLDRLAYDFYRDESLWWVIAYRNEILDPFNITVSEIAIPNKQDLITVLGKYQNDTN